jgi:NADPH:quinone reductase-like Zn-dependent oxidoreductase
MRAAVLREYGAAPEPAEFDAPQAGTGQVVVEVSAGGMNPVEIAIASGQFYGARPELPVVVGREGVGRLADGSRVFFPLCLPPYGSFAQQALVPEAAVIPLPDEVEDGVAIALWTSGLAAWGPLVHMARIKAGDAVLVLGSSGVVGQLAIQLARHYEAGRVVGAARSEAGRERSAELGAERVVELRDPGDDAAPDALRADLADAAGDGFDIVVDLLSGPFTNLGLDSLARGGRQVLVGSTAGDDLELKSSGFRSRNSSLSGYSSVHVDPPTLVAAYRELLDLAVAGKLRVESERVPLAEVGRAWSLQAEGPRRKIVVVPD